MLFWTMGAVVSLDNVRVYAFTVIDVNTIACLSNKTYVLEIIRLISFYEEGINHYLWALIMALTRDRMTVPFRPEGFTVFVDEVKK